MRRLRLFVYGTLQPGAGTAMAGWLAARTLRAGAASVPGRLIALESGRGWYPALVPGAGRVRGVLCELALSPGELALLDRYEGREYRRACLPVQGDGLRGRTAVTYVWRAALPSGRAMIADGDFAGWLQRTRRRVYAGA